MSSSFGADWLNVTLPATTVAPVGRLAVAVPDTFGPPVAGRLYATLPATATALADSGCAATSSGAEANAAAIICASSVRRADEAMRVMECLETERCGKTWSDRARPGPRALAAMAMETRGMSRLARRRGPPRSGVADHGADHGRWSRPRETQRTARNGSWRKFSSSSPPASGAMDAEAFQQRLLNGDAYRSLWPFARPCTSGIRPVAYRFTESRNRL